MDGFLGAYWHRPDAYLSSAIRDGMSSFARVSSVHDGVERLRAELASGEWDAKYGELRSRAELDVGYRIVIGSPPRKTK